MSNEIFPLRDLVTILSLVSLAAVAELTGTAQCTLLSICERSMRHFLLDLPVGQASRAHEFVASLHFCRRQHRGRIENTRLVLHSDVVGSEPL